MPLFVRINEVKLSVRGEGERQRAIDVSHTQERRAGRSNISGQVSERWDKVKAGT